MAGLLKYLGLVFVGICMRMQMREQGRSPNIAIWKGVHSDNFTMRLPQSPEPEPSVAVQWIKHYVEGRGVLLFIGSVLVIFCVIYDINVYGNILEILKRVQYKYEFCTVFCLTSSNVLLVCRILLFHIVSMDTVFFLLSQRQLGGTWNTSKIHACAH